MTDQQPWSQPNYSRPDQQPQPQPPVYPQAVSAATRNCPVTVM